MIVGSRGKSTFEPIALVMRDAAVFGVLLPNATPAEDTRIHAALGAGFTSGALRPLIYKEYPLAQAPISHHELMESHVASKIVPIP